MSEISVYYHNEQLQYFAGDAFMFSDDLRLPANGAGFLAGSFPDGLTTVDGVPAEAEVRVLFRPASGGVSDGVVVATVMSGQDGVWRVEGLDPALRFDVVGRKAGFNDVLMSNVQPVVP